MCSVSLALGPMRFGALVHPPESGHSGPKHVVRSGGLSLHEFDRTTLSSAWRAEANPVVAVFGLLGLEIPIILELTNPPTWTSPSPDDMSCTCLAEQMSDCEPIFVIGRIWITPPNSSPRARSTALGEAGGGVGEILEGY